MRAAVARAIGDWIVGGIHHVGSTAVPGLEAKPIIDILVGVRDLEESRECFEPLARLDYLYAPYLPEEMHWFCKPHPSRRTHHLHLVPGYTAELAFRDRPRADPKARADYAALKRKLAARLAQDREAYTEGKSARYPSPSWDGPERLRQRRRFSAKRSATSCLNIASGMGRAALDTAPT